MDLEKIIQRAIQISVILSGITLILYAIVGTQARMVADDYCAAYGGITYHPIDGAIQQYNVWTARYIDYFLEYVFAPFQPAIYPLFAAITLSLWLLVVAYAVYHVLEFLKFEGSRQYVVPITIILTFVMYRLLPSYQHAFWLAAIIPYVWSAILLIFWIGTVFQYFSEPRSLAILIRFLVWTSLVMLLLGGLIETVITGLGMVFALLLLATPFTSKPLRKHYLSFVLVGGISAGIALLIILLSPGAWARREFGIQLDGINPSAWDALPDGILYTLAYMFGELFGITFGQTFGIAFLGSLFLMGFVWSVFYLEKNPDYVLPAPKNLFLAFGLSFASAILLMFAVIYPTYYAARAVLPIRPLILGRLIQLFVTIYWTYLAVAAAQRHHILEKLREAKTWSLMLIVLAIMFVWMPLISIYKLVNLFPDYQAYAQSWDERHDLLLDAEPDETVVIPPLRFDIEDVYDLGKLGEDADFWINGCAAAYYGVEGISVESDPLD